MIILLRCRITNESVPITRTEALLVITIVIKAKDGGEKILPERKARLGFLPARQGGVYLCRL